MRRAGLLAASALALTACGTPEAAAPAAAPPPVAVRVAAVRRGPIAATVAASGETVALTAVRIASPVSGRVTALAAHAGDPLAAGAVAARVMPQENEAALHGLRVLDEAGALRPDERPAAARLAREVAARDIPLRAPFRGIVADRLRNPGEQVAPSDVLLELFDPRSLVVIAQVPAIQAAAVHPDDAVAVRIAGAESTGRVAMVLAAVSPQSLTVPVRIRLDAPPHPPLLHAAADCRITVAVHAAALLVPRAALLTDDGLGDGTVMLARDGVARLRRVRLGLRDGEAVEVDDGLAAGDTVLVAGQYGLPDGAAVAPQPADAE